MTANLGPTMNLIRTWHGGRSAETYGEDPYLIAELAVPEIQGMQAQGVIATVKHFAANNQEASRVGVHPDMAGIDEHISEKALQEIYFPHFKAAVQRARAGAVMCAYNKINGEFSCNNSKLLGQLRDWGFDGTIVPDAIYAQRDPVAAAKAGVDSASPTSAVVKAMQSGEVDPLYFDRKVYHALVTRFRHGLYDNPTRGNEGAKVSTVEHVKLARDIAANGTVLLKNNGNVLPLERAKSIAIIGADASAAVVVMETGSPNVHVGTLSVPVDAIRARAGDKVRVEYARGNVGVRALPPVPAEVLAPPSGKGHGLEGTYFGTPYFWTQVATRVDEKIELGADPNIPSAPEGINGKREFTRGRDPWSVQWAGTLTPPATGLYTFSLTGSGTGELYIDHQLVTTFQRGDFARTAVGTISLTAGHRASVLIKFDTASALLGIGIKLGWQPPDSRLAEAVEAAKRAEVAVVFAGEQLGEGYDKISLNLPGDQDALIDAVAAANPRTVVVLHTSTAVAMPWIDKVAAVVEAWYPGQEAGRAIADVLFGDVNPSGKLPVTFPRDESQGPATSWMSYPGNGRSVEYSEGIFVGYRWYDAKNQQPLFPFGHGLSYTTFEYSDLTFAGDDEKFAVQFKMKNTGTRAGAEVAQLYVQMPDGLNEPPRQLKGFEKVLLKPGESRVVTLPLPVSLLEVYDEGAGAWRLYGGKYSALVGASSRDIRLQRDWLIPID
jgi:beta-glucosidase